MAKKNEETKKRINITIYDSVLEIADKESDRLDMNRSDYIAKCINDKNAKYTHLNLKKEDIDSINHNTEFHIKQLLKSLPSNAHYERTLTEHGNLIDILIEKVNSLEHSNLILISKLEEATNVNNMAKIMAAALNVIKDGSSRNTQAPIHNIKTSQKQGA